MKIANTGEMIKPQDVPGVNKNKQISQETSSINQTHSSVSVQISDEAKQKMQEQSFWQDYLERQRECEKENEESGKGDDMAKCLRIARRIAKGDIVPPGDEKKLMEYDFKLYMMSKSAAMMADNKNPKKHKSEYEDEEDGNIREMVRALENETSDAEIPEVEVKSD